MTCNPHPYEEKPYFEKGEFNMICKLFGHSAIFYDDYPYFTVECERCHTVGRTGDRIFACYKHNMRRLLKGGNEYLK